MKIWFLQHAFLLLSYVSLASPFKLPSLDSVVKDASTTFESIGKAIPIPPNFNLLRTIEDFGGSMKDLGDRGVAFMDLGVSMKDMGDRSFAFLDEKFREEAAKHPGAVEMFEEYKDAIEGLVRAVEEFTIGKEGVLEKRGINLNELAQALADQLEEVVNTTVAEFSEPAPEDLDEWCKLKDLDVRVSKILDQVEDAFVAAFATFGLQVPEFEVRASFGHLKPHLKRVVMIVARFCCRHPILCSMVALTAMVYVTRGPLIRKVLCLSGFGPLGPIKGSRAAWIQSKWFGAIIPKGSWFSFLQWLAMGYYKGWHC